MAATFIHLSGSKRGTVETRGEEHIKIGSGEECDFRFDLQRDPLVAALHAEIRFENCEYSLSDKGRGTFVNNRMAPEIILQDGDIIEFGEGGPKVRFRIRPEDQPCKPFRDICADCFDRTILGGKNRLVAFPSFFKTMLQEVYREASWKVRVSVFSILFLMIASIVGSPLFLYKSYVDRLHYEKSLLRLSGEMQSDRLSQKELEKRLLEAREQLTHYRTETEAALTRLRQERDRLETQLKDSTDLAEQGDARIRDLESQLSVATRKIHDLEREEKAGESVIQRDMGGVAFLEVVYTFEDQAGRRIRFSRVDSSGEPVRDAAGEAPVSVEGKGPIVSIRSSGTGFLVRAGEILTNRHVAEPWWEDQGAKPFIDSGFRPVSILSRAFFPGIKEPFPLRTHRLSDKADVALLRFDQKGVKLPVLNLDSSPGAAIVGRPVILIGYPTGVEALLARVDPATLRKMIETQGSRVNEIINELSQQGLIRPLATWGHVSDVRPHQLTYDALTTSGGSGSPIVNTRGKVIGINHAVLVSFTGSNFGIPIRFGLELMDQR
ncbi:MAG: trypsin-like peptidase domain-containing protein [Candidatus Tectomicrobia bacterium]|uniref:Trypsin-like peptidase domain-containing protein n=1 Tax=Tectimicrobiota bacterium TaxID=2528274 RepID=A0A932GQ87_UNCTE|nr:trypsin-like peptidase domain-containing protein [Candidatus Tectomicrobia bacterium]